MRVEDEWGHPWHIAGGDPGSKPMNFLRRLGYAWVVLPYQTLAWGEVAEPAVQLESMGVLERTRLLDCLEDLSAA